MAAVARTHVAQLITDAIPLSMMMSRQGERTITRRLWWKLMKFMQPVGPFRAPVGNRRLCVNASDPIHGHRLLKYGLHDEEEWIVLRNILKSGDTFLDVGANLGFYTTLAAEVVGPDGHVCAVEPEPVNLGMLKTNIETYRIDDIVDVVRAAASAGEGEIQFFVDAGNFGGHSASLANVMEKTDVIRVPTVALDDVLAGRKNKIKAIKVDTQGNELNVFRGATRILSEDKPFLVIEWWPFGLSNMGSSASELAKLISGFGYNTGLLSMNDNKAVIERTTWDDLLSHYDENDRDSVGNIVATHGDIAALFSADDISVK